MRSRVPVSWAPLAWAAALLLAPACARAGDSAAPSITDSGTLYNALWAVGIFLVLLGLLGRLAWKPLLQVLRQREQHIADTLARIETQQKEGERLLAEYQGRLEAADAAVAGRLQEAQRQADRARQEILQAARKEAEDVARRAAAEIDAAKKVAIGDLYALGAQLATAAAEKIIRKELTGEDHRRIIVEALEQIRREGQGRMN